MDELRLNYNSWGLLAPARLHSTRTHSRLTPIQLSNACIFILSARWAGRQHYTCQAMKMQCKSIQGLSHPTLTTC